MKAPALRMEEVYEALVGVALQGQPLSKIQDYVDSHFMGYGTSEDEMLKGWDGLKWMIERQRKEMEKSSMTLTRHPILKTKLGHDNITLIVEEFEFKITSEEGPYSFTMRLSTILEYNQGKWMLRHFHGSTADADTPEGNAWPVEEWKRRNAELQQLVEEKTKELSAQNQELEIEAALERVRAVAMSMRTPEELQRVGKVIFSELKVLGFDALRNTEIIINRDEKQAMLSYYYSDYGVSGTIEVDYTTHPVLKWAEDLKAAGDGFAGVHISEGEMKSWRQYRLDLGYIPDPKLDQADSLDYYSYSTGSGALSISSFTPISPEQLAILERFRNVFGLAYRRYVDVEQAEAQTREAQIEAALERVRARSMAMHSSEELAEVAQVMFDQMKLLGGELFAFGIVLCDQHENMVEQWHSLGDAGMMSPFLVPIDLDYIHRYRYDQWQAKVEVFSIEIPSDYIARHFELMFELPSVMAAKEELAAKGIEVEAPPWEIDYGASFRYGYLLVSSLEPFAEEHIFPRFAKVFEQAYTRFLDLQKAEAQAREAQIEAALERIRAQTMAMHNSEDVGECTVKMFGELTALGVDEDTRFGIGILNHDNVNNQLWTASKEGKEVNMHIGNLDMTSHPLLKSARKAWKEQLSLHKYVLEGEDLLNYYKMLNNAPDYKIRIDIEKLPEREFHYGFVFDHGFFYAFNPREFQPDLIQIIQRFSSLFAQTYRRYLDLVKAEGQAREAQIEAALEKVRSYSLAVNKVDEFNDVVTIVFEKLSEFDIPVSSVTIAVVKEQPKDFDVFGCGESETGLTTLKFGLPYFSNPFMDDLIQARMTTEVGYISKVYSENQKNIYYDYVLKNTELKNLPEDIKQRILKCTSYGLSTAFARNSMIMINDMEGNILDAGQAVIVKRFSTVFEQAYIRFLDLQKAETQAREAQIETTLERVRSRTMGMQKSEELKAVIEVLFNQLVKLEIFVQHTGFILDYKNRDDMLIWLADDNAVFPQISIPYFDSPHWNSFLEAKEKGRDLFTNHLNFEEKKSLLQKTLYLYTRFNRGNQRILFPMSRLSHIDSVAG